MSAINTIGLIFLFLGSSILYATETEPLLTFSKEGIYYGKIANTKSSDPAGEECQLEIIQINKSFFGKIQSIQVTSHQFQNSETIQVNVSSHIEEGKSQTGVLSDGKTLKLYDGAKFQKTVDGPIQFRLPAFVIYSDKYPEKSEILTDCENLFYEN